MKAIIFYSITEAEIEDHALLRKGLADVASRGFDGVYIEFRNIRSGHDGPRLYAALRVVCREAEALGLGVVAEAAVVPTIIVDGALTIDGANLDLAHQIERLGPFGSGNAEPRFAFSGLRLVKADIVGTAHTRCIFTDGGGGRLPGISFRSADMPLGQALLNHGGMPVNVVGKVRENIWQGRSSVQLMIDDAAPSSS